jgi:hypothetical protein
MVSASAQQAAPAPSPSIGYPTVAAAFEALRRKSGVKVINQGGWTIIDDPSDKTIWSFAPPGYPAYPAAIRRQIIEDSRGISLKMNILCEAAAAPCDKLSADFQALNDKMRENIKRSHAP